MGADIHWDVEVRDGEGWRRIEADEALEAAGITLEELKARETDWRSEWIGYGLKEGKTRLRWPKARQYTVFGALGDVRVDTQYEYGLPAFAPRRGLPSDWTGKTEVYGKYTETIDPYVGDHSRTWFILSELLDWYGWDHVCGDYTLREQTCPELLEMFFEVLPKVADPKNIRIIMGFDS